MRFKDCLLAENVEVRLDTYETRPCQQTAEYRTWAWVCELVVGTTEDCVRIAREGDKIMDKARDLAERSGNVRGHAWHLLRQRGITHSAAEVQPGKHSCTACSRAGSCTIEVSRERLRAWIEQHFRPGCSV